MNIITLDFESHFSDEYMLKKLSTEAYIRDPRFEAHGCAVRWPDTGTQWYGRDRLPFLMEQLSNCAPNTAFMCWHAQFDGAILAHHYNIKPKFWICPMSMARLMLGNHVSVSLDSVRAHFGLPAKTTPYNLFRGKHWNEMTPDVQRQVAEGAIDEVESIMYIFNKLMAGEH